MTDVSSAPAPQTAPPPDPPAVKQVVITTGTIWRAVGIVLATLTAIWAVDQMRGLVLMLVVSVFFTLALTPGVNYLHAQTGMAPGCGRRGDLRGRRRRRARDGRADRAGDRQGRRPDLRAAAPSG